MFDMMFADHHSNPCAWLHFATTIQRPFKLHTNSHKHTLGSLQCRKEFDGDWPWTWKRTGNCTQITFCSFLPFYGSSCNKIPISVDTLLGVKQTWKLTKNLRGFDFLLQVNLSLNLWYFEAKVMKRGLLVHKHKMLGEFRSEWPWLVTEVILCTFFPVNMLSNIYINS